MLHTVRLDPLDEAGGYDDPAEGEAAHHLPEGRPPVVPGVHHSYLGLAVHPPLEELLLVTMCYLAARDTGPGPRWG